MRHAKAEPSFAGGDDLGRGLTERGKADAFATSADLMTKGLAPDIVLASPARRTIETWKAASVLHTAKFEILEGLYLAEPDTLLATIELYAAKANRLMIIGHNPGLHQLSLDLLGVGAKYPNPAARLYRGMPTASAGVFNKIGDGMEIKDFDCTDFISLESKAE